jgi:hypothetical protein
VSTDSVNGPVAAIGGQPKLPTINLDGVIVASEDGQLNELFDNEALKDGVVEDGKVGGGVAQGGAVEDVKVGGGKDQGGAGQTDEGLKKAKELYKNFKTAYIALTEILVSD